jgi:putative RecB family exonuclease
VTTEQPEQPKMPDYLSASSISTWEQCPLRYKYSRLDGIPEPETDSQIMGNFVHEILEHIYKLPNDQRTSGNAQQISRTVWANGWAERLAVIGVSETKMREFRWKSWWCVENLWLIENPQDISPIGLEAEYYVEVLPGIKIKGFVDRISPNGDGIKITDYKTGKFPRPAYMDQKWFQLLLYKVVVEQTLNKSVTEVQLIYLKDGKSIARKTTPEDNEPTLARVLSVHGEIKESIQTGNFPTKVSKLCDWCSYKKICPAWSARRR